MFGLFGRPKLTARLVAARAVSDEFARRVDLAGQLILSNAGADANLALSEMIIIAGFRRIPLVVPSEWRAFRIGAGTSWEGKLGWSLSLDAPLRSPTGELYIAALDQRRRKWEWRLPFTFEQR
jgi:hypothetical protein